MEYTSKQYFADWYRGVEINFDSQVIENRIKSIEDLLENEEYEFWLDVVRLSLGIEVKEDSKGIFINAFKDIDPTFPLIGNDNIVKTLATISLAFLLEGQNDTLNNIISLGIINSAFLRQYDTIDIIPIRKMAFSFQTRVSILSREETIHDLENLENVIENLTEKSSELIEIIQSTNHSLDVLREQNTILWWLFSEYCTLANKHFSEIEKSNMIFLAPKELSDLTSFSYGINSAKSILRKAIQLSANTSQSETVNIYQLINSLSEENKLLLVSKNTELSEMTPCLSALQMSMLFGNSTEWSGLFKKKFNDADIQLSLAEDDIAFQIYTELIFLSAIESYE